VVGVPVAGRRQIEFPVLRLFFDPQKNFKTGRLPELILAAGRRRWRWQEKVREVPVERIMQSKQIVLTGNIPGDGDLRNSWRRKRG